MALDRLTGEHSAVFVRSEQLFDVARRNSLWYLLCGTACCGVEMMHAAGARFDLGRFGVLRRDDPRQSDVMVVAGTVNEKMADTLLALYERMPDPRWVIAMGACASTGGPFREYPNVLLGVDRVIPVDVYIPGCPPGPASLQHGFTQLRDKIRRRTEERLASRRDSRS